MKISIKIDPETLFLLHAIVRQSVNYNKAKRDKSMDVEIFEILSKKCFAYSLNPNGKDRGITLRWHLAKRIYEVANEEYIWMKLGNYENNKLRIFTNQLHQKLL